MFVSLVAYTILKIRKVDVEDFTLMLCAIAETILWGVIIVKML